jgi:hypothetical protein
LHELREEEPRSSLRLDHLRASGSRA